MTAKDLRAKNTFSLRGRSFSHWTPQYILHRSQRALWKWRRPTDPDLTRESISLLARLLRATDVGAEWGAGNSTGWFAERTRSLLSFEASLAYGKVVRENLETRGIRNVDLRSMDFIYDTDEQQMHRHRWLLQVHEILDSSLDFALVDTAPRGCLCNILVGKLKIGGLLILDNANWYLPPPNDLHPFPVSSVSVPLGYPNSRDPRNLCWPAFVGKTEHWRKVWTTDGVTATLIMVKPMGSDVSEA